MRQLGQQDIPISDFLPYVLPYVSGCVDIVALSAIQFAIIEFCNDTDWLLFRPKGITVGGSADPYQVALAAAGGQNAPPPYNYEFLPNMPTGYEMVRPLTVFLNGLQLTPINLDTVKEVYGLDWQWVTDYPRFWMQQAQNSVNLVPAPSWNMPEEPLDMILSARPTLGDPMSAMIDQSLLDTWAEVIAYGARAKLHAVPNEPFYNERTSMKFQSMFMVGKGRAKAFRRSGGSPLSMRVRPPKVV